MANAIEGAARPPFVVQSIFLPKTLPPPWSYLPCSTAITLAAKGAIVIAWPISLRSTRSARSGALTTEEVTPSQRPRSTAGSARPDSVAEEAGQRAARVLLGALTGSLKIWQARPSYRATPHPAG